MIEIFPTFSKFNLANKAKYNSYLKNFAAYGDLSFTNFAIWLNIADDLELSDLNGNLVLRFTNVFEEPKVKRYCLVGLIDVDTSIESLFKFLKENNENTTLYSVPEETVKLITRFKYDEDRDSFDYIYSTEEQLRLLGTKFGKYRRRVNNFIESNMDELVINEFDLSDEYTHRKVVNSLHTWDRAYVLANNDVERWESHAIARSFKYCNELNLRCIGIVINSKIEAFTIFSVDDVKSTSDIHHTKCSYEHRNIFDFTLYATASRLRTENIKYINLEQDLGIDGLREHKLGLRPSSFLKKYNVYCN